MFLQSTVVERGDLGKIDEPTALITIRLTLEEKKRNRRQPLFSNTYTTRLPVNDTSAETLVRAWNRGLESILVRAVNDMTSAIHHTRVPLK